MELLTVIYCTLKYFQFYNFIFVQFMSMVCAGKKDLSNVRLLESKEKLGGNPAIVRDDQATTILKGLNTGQYMAFSFQIKVQFALKNAWLPPIFFFFFGIPTPLLNICFFRRNHNVLCRTYVHSKRRHHS